MRRQGWTVANRNGRGRHKKLRTALRYHLSGGAETERFKEENAIEDPEFAAFLANRPRVEKPEVLPHTIPYWEAWQELRGDRPIDGFGGQGNISYLAMSRYAADHEFFGEDFLIFKTIIRGMDDEYLSWVAEQRKKETPNGNKA